jgi:hypothetical protein
MRVDEDALDRYGHFLDEDPPLGALIGSVTLVDCVQDSRSEWAEPGAWHWLLHDAHKLVHPRWMSGKLGLWTTSAIGEGWVWVIPQEKVLELLTSATAGHEQVLRLLEDQAFIGWMQEAHAGDTTDQITEIMKALRGAVSAIELLMTGMRMEIGSGNVVIDSDPQGRVFIGRESDIDRRN